MVKASISLEDLNPYELVDASATVMKEPHKKYGAWIKKLADVVRTSAQPPKGHWQAYWTVGARAFNLLLRGHDKEVVKRMVAPLAESFGIASAVSDKLVEDISNSIGYIAAERGRPTAEAVI